MSFDKQRKDEIHPFSANSGALDTDLIVGK